MNMFLFHKILKSLLIVIPALSVFCTSDGNPGPKYQPVIIFEGYFDNEWLNLAGNNSMPNTIGIDNDTVDISFYSEDFDNADISMRSGVALKISIFPFTQDSLCGFCTRHLRVNLSDYSATPVQKKYSVYPADTAYGQQFASSAEVEILERTPGGQIDLRDLDIPMHLEGSTSYSAGITEGRIYLPAE